MCAEKTWRFQKVAVLPKGYDGSMMADQRVTTIQNVLIRFVYIGVHVICKTCSWLFLNKSCIVQERISLPLDGSVDLNLSYGIESQHVVSEPWWFKIERWERWRNHWRLAQGGKKGDRCIVLFVDQEGSVSVRDSIEDCFNEKECMVDFLSKEKRRKKERSIWNLWCKYMDKKIIVGGSDARFELVGVVWGWGILPSIIDIKESKDRSNVVTPTMSI